MKTGSDAIAEELKRMAQQVIGTYSKDEAQEEYVKAQAEHGEKARLTEETSDGKPFYRVLVDD